MFLVSGLIYIYIHYILNNTAFKAQPFEVSFISHDSEEMLNIGDVDQLAAPRLFNLRCANVTKEHLSPPRCWFLHSITNIK